MNISSYTEQMDQLDSLKDNAKLTEFTLNDKHAKDDAYQHLNSDDDNNIQINVDLQSLNMSKDDKYSKKNSIMNES